MERVGIRHDNNNTLKYIQNIVLYNSGTHMNVFLSASQLLILIKIGSMIILKISKIYKQPGLFLCNDFLLWTTVRRFHFFAVVWSKYGLELVLWCAFAQLYGSASSYERPMVILVDKIMY